MLSLITILALSYLAGSFPSSIIAGKVFRGIDIREHGSGNAGATNVIRVMGWKIGLLVFILDVAKGLIAVLFIADITFTGGRILLGGYELPGTVVGICAGMAAVFGHIWTIFAGFKGGKGVATAAGMVLGLAPVETLISIGVFALTAVPTRYVSVGSMTAAVTFTAVIMFRRFGLGHEVDTPLVVFSVFVAVLIIFTHRTNLKRLLNGTENKFGKK
ncbi:MAG: glycerol-3-phosphate 1-O-acyltransferase PlsY [bacterium]|nr:glycerol-3-phosphate 1-O-acyltransferase PlsY [bacterium]